MNHSEDCKISEQAKEEMSDCYQFLQRNDISDRDREAALRGLNDWFAQAVFEEFERETK